MEELLPHYERELAFLRRDSREFAERYPKIAAQLLLNGEGCDDPHVERMIESFALLSARINKKLEDSYPQFTEALLSVLYPHYLRPFPACSIARFERPGSAAGPAQGVRIARGTELQSRPVRGAACRFRTAWDVDLGPVAVESVQFRPLAEAPAGVRLPSGCTALLTIELTRVGKQARWGEGALRAPRVFIDAEPSTAAVLRDALFLRVAGAFASRREGQWQAIAGTVIEEVGLADDQALIDFPDNAHSAYRHLTEYFAFPEKYNFFDLALARLPDGLRDAQALVIHLAVQGLQVDSDAARLLQGLSQENLRLGCVPVVNLFAQRGDPIRLSGHRSSYPVVADARKAYAYEVCSIDAVRRLRKTPQGEELTEYRPFFSLYHGERPTQDGHYWYAQRDELVAERSPGYEVELSLVDADFDPLQDRTDVLSLSLTCTNRDLPALLAIGMPGGDLFMEGGGAVDRVSLLRKPTKPYRFEHRQGGQWRLVSHLSLNHLSLSGSGVQAFREMLNLYDLPRNAVSRRQIDGVVGIEQRTQTAWLAGNPFASFVRGLQVELTVDEDAFVGTGLDAFARVIDRFLGLYVHLNSFVQLVLVSHRSGEELIRCAPRSGESILA